MTPELGFCPCDRKCHPGCSAGAGRPLRLCRVGFRDFSSPMLSSSASLVTVYIFFTLAWGLVSFQEVGVLRQQLGDRLNIEVDAAPPVDLTRMLEEMRCQYETMVETNHRDVEEWFNMQVGTSLPGGWALQGPKEGTLSPPPFLCCRWRSLISRWPQAPSSSRATSQTSSI